MYVFRGGGGGGYAALCLVLSHPAINCVSTAAVCFGQIGAELRGPSASLHWDELPDLLIPTDPSRAPHILLYLAFFPPVYPLMCFI